MEKILKPKRGVFLVKKKKKGRKVVVSESNVSHPEHIIVCSAQYLKKKLLAYIEKNPAT